MRYNMMARYNMMPRRRNAKKRKRKPRGVLGGIDTKKAMYGAAGGAVGGFLLTAAAGAARGMPSGPAMPKNASVGALFGALGSLLAKSPQGAAIIGALAAGTGIYAVNVMKAAAAPTLPEGTAGLGMLPYMDPLMASRLNGLGVNVQEAIAGCSMGNCGGMGDYVTPGSFYSGQATLGEYVSPSQRYDAGDLGEYVTPGAFLEGLGQLMPGDFRLADPRPSPGGFMPRMASRAPMPAGWCAAC